MWFGTVVVAIVFAVSLPTLRQSSITLGAAVEPE
jgi:hypothetical protein